ncbi:MAG TPA: protein kinase [Gemmatimonadales bacterium]|nr:protein kinase [Gemmatimonadales bacterium]
MNDRLAAALADRYRLERELGAGGMATVYLAEDLKHHRKVAVKVLRPELADVLGPERFLREIEIAANLRHPHILPLYDSGNADGFLFYVMPLVEGDSLATVIRREKQLPIEDALRYAREVADALSYAHAHGVVHRDIKPDNIMIESGHAVVADFGIAKAVASAGDVTALTGTGMSVGTPTYMSPEQATGDRDIDGRSDLYSLGCVLYEMLAGQPPFSGATIDVLVRQHIMTAPPPVTQFRPAVPPSVADALARALAKVPADRFNPVGQFASAIGTGGGGGTQPVSAPKPRPSRLIPASIGAGILLLAVAVWALFLRGKSATAGGSTDNRSIAVLPFENIGGDTANQSFVLGVHAEIITQLGKLNGLRVASRSSALQYRETTKNEREVASELGVATLLTGSIQRSGGQVHLNVALEDVAKGQQLWSDSYDRELTPQNLFALQGEIATKVASALSVRLTREQEAEIVKAPTTNLAALDLYYRGLDSWNNRTVPGQDTVGVHRLEEAVALDSSFARAWGLLAQSRSWRLRNGSISDTLPARQAADRVRALAPGSLEARLAYGYYLYYGQGKYAGALEELDAADRLLPNTSEIISARGLLLRRLGRWDEALALITRAVDLDPRSQSAMVYLGETYVLLHRYDEAAEAYSRLLAMDPRSASGIANRFMVLLYGQGDTTQAASFFQSSVPLLNDQNRSTLQSRMAAFRRDYPAATAAAMEADPRVLTVNFGGRDIGLALLYRAAGDSVRMRAWADSAIRLDQDLLEVRRRRGPDDPFGAQSIVELQSAIAYALKGDSARAVPMAERAAARYSPERDAVEGLQARRWLAITYTLVGRTGDAVGILRDMLQRPCMLGLGDLRFDPTWDPLRNDPGFQQLVAGQ